MAEAAGMSARTAMTSIHLPSMLMNPAICWIGLSDGATMRARAATITRPNSFSQITRGRKAMRQHRF